MLNISEVPLNAQHDVLVRLAEELSSLIGQALVLARLELQVLGLAQHADGLAVGCVRRTYVWLCCRSLQAVPR